MRPDPASEPQTSSESQDSAGSTAAAAAADAVAELLLQTTATIGNTPSVPVTYYHESLTITPATTLNNVPFTTAELRNNTQPIRDGLVKLLDQMFADGTIVWYSVSVEVGGRNKKYHLQVSIHRRVPGWNIDLRKLNDEFKKRITAAVRRVTQKGLRVAIHLKPVKRGDEDVHGGYLFKDFGLASFENHNRGLSREETDRMIAAYRAKHGSTPFTSNKIHTQAGEKEKKFDINSGNRHTLEDWFMVHHGLRALLGYLSTVGWINVALQTDSYKLHHDLITGSKGEPVDEARNNATRLANFFPSDRFLNRDRIRLVLFGDAPAPQMITHPNPLVPGPAALETMSLGEMRLLCRTLDANYAAATASLEGPQKSGRFFVGDLKHPNQASTGAALIMQNAGLVGNMVLASNQLDDNICGYVAAGLALFARALGPDFTDITHEHAQLFNRNDYINTANNILQKQTVEWLETAEIHQLVAANNPDGPGPARWLTVGAYNNFKDYFAQTLENPEAHGTVHYMIVNDAVVTNLLAEASGSHWFFAAWYVEPNES